MVSKKLTLTGILSSGEKLFDSSIKIASVLQGELHDLKERATLMEDKQRLEKSTADVDDLISQLSQKQSDFKELISIVEDDLEESISMFADFEAEYKALIETLPDFSGYEEILIIKGNAVDEIVMLKQNVVTIRQILMALTELTRLFRYVNDNV